METQESLLPLLMGKEMQQVTVCRNRTELVTTRTEQEVLTPPTTHSITPTPKPFLASLTVSLTQAKHNLPTYNRVRKGSETGAVLRWSWLTKAINTFLLINSKF